MDRQPSSGVTRLQMVIANSLKAQWGWDETGPVWGARAFAPRSGQDHLGLGSVCSDRILPALSPGINVLTIHPRYWSFYSWVLDGFWAADLPRTRSAFRDFYRPREALFAMACHVCDAPEHTTLVANVVGSRRVRPKADDTSFDPQFNYIKEALGGYGLYYRSAMELTGALIVAGSANGFPFDAPTPIGRALAAAFRGAVARTRLEAACERDDLASPVPRDVLVEFARAACLCQLRVADLHDLPLLQDLFLHSGTQQQVGSRSETLRMFLDLSQCRPGEAIGQEDFRQIVYFRELEDSRYEPRPELADVARRWRVYQGREYFGYVFNRLLRWVSRRGLAETDAGLTLLPSLRLWELVAQALDGSAADPQIGLVLPEADASTRVADFLHALKEEIDTDVSADGVWPRHAGLDEHALYQACRDFDTDDGITLLCLIALILLLRERFGLPNRAGGFHQEQDLLAEGGALRNGMARFMHLLNQRLLPGPTMAELARWLIEDFVIIQHERVAAAKLPDDTYRVRRVGDRLRFFALEVPAVFNDSRFVALSTTAHELGWVTTLREPDRVLTSSGAALLTDTDLPGGALEAAVHEVQGPRTA
jgi:hypothetical protein